MTKDTYETMLDKYAMTKEEVDYIYEEFGEELALLEGE